MSPLDPAKIRELMIKNEAAKAKPKQTRTGRRASSKTDPNDRSAVAWFKLEHHLLDDSDEPVFCDNPDCIDPRPKERGQVVAEVVEKRMCRFCFFDGWLVENPAQTAITDADAA